MFQKLLDCDSALNKSKYLRDKIFTKMQFFRIIFLKEELKVKWDKALYLKERKYQKPLQKFLPFRLSGYGQF